MKRQYELFTWGILATILFIVAVLFVAALSLPADSYACPRYQLTPGPLVREYNGHDGLLYREYDHNNDGKADWGTAYQVENGVPKAWPLFYAAGFDDATVYNDKEHPFVAVVVWQDKEVKGQCTDIVEVYVRQKGPFNPDKPNSGSM